MFEHLVESIDRNPSIGSAILLSVIFPMTWILCLVFAERDKEWSKEKELRRWKDNNGDKVPIYSRMTVTEKVSAWFFIFVFLLFLILLVDTLLKDKISWSIQNTDVEVAITIGLTTLTAAIAAIIYAVEKKRELLVYTLHDLVLETRLDFFAETSFISLFCVCCLEVLFTGWIDMSKASKGSASIVFVLFQISVVCNLISNVVVIWKVLMWMFSETDLKLLKKLQLVLRWRNYEKRGITKKKGWKYETTKRSIAYLLDDYVDISKKIKWKGNWQICFGSAFEEEKKLMGCARGRMVILHVTACVFALLLLWAPHNHLQLDCFMSVLGLGLLSYIPFLLIRECMKRKYDQTKSLILRLAGYDVWGFWCEKDGKKKYYCQQIPRFPRCRIKHFWISRNNLIAFFLITTI